jgi:hypothetical protein
VLEGDTPVSCLAEVFDGQIAEAQGAVLAREDERLLFAAAVETDDLVGAQLFAESCARGLGGDAEGDEINRAIAEARQHVVDDRGAREHLEVVHAAEAPLGVERAVGAEHRASGREADDVVLQLVD